MTYRRVLHPTTFIADIDNNNPLVAQEQFGTALPVIKYSTVEEAIELGNALDVGLGAPGWSSDKEKAPEVASGLLGSLSSAVARSDDLPAAHEALAASPLPHR